MSKQQNALRLALEALETGGWNKTTAAITALREALAEQPLEMVEQPADEPSGPLVKGWSITFGEGHAGYGVYAHMEEYPEEGAFLLLSVEQPAQQEPVVMVLPPIVEPTTKSEPVYIMGSYVGTGEVSSVTFGGVSFAGNGTAGREADVKPTGFFFQMPKPVGEVYGWHGTGKGQPMCRFNATEAEMPVGTKLYTSPPASKPWVGLTQQDIDIAFDDTQEGGGFNEFARAIEAKLKEKNK